MGGVHQAPALVDIDVFIQPLQWPAATPGQAVVDFLLLFGNVDMHRAGLVAGSHDLGDLLRGDRAQGVKAQPQALRRLLGEQRRQLRVQVQVLLGAVDEATLPVIGRLPAETRVAVQHRQQGQADAGVGGGLADAQRQFGRVGIGLALGVMVHVMEFGHRGVAGLEHLDVQLARDDAQLLGADPAHQPIHQLAPGPEAIVGVAGHFRQAGHGALEGVRVQVRHAR